MSFAETVEYYDECPSCGARNTGGSLCEYCGASMIKKKITLGESGRSNIEEDNANEDCNLPHIDGKSGRLDPFILLFCSIFGGCFVFVPLIVSTAFISSGIMEIWVILMMVLFLMIGIGSLVPLFLGLINGAKCKKGEVMTGEVRYYTRTGTTVNGQYVMRIHLKTYKNGSPVIISFSTGQTGKPYPIGSTVTFRNYKDYYRIEKK